jgi:hypothetical protein
MCERRCDKARFALKCLRDRDESKREVRGLPRSLTQASLLWLVRGHRNIVQLIDVYENTIKVPQGALSFDGQLFHAELSGFGAEEAISSRHGAYDGDPIFCFLTTGGRIV